MVIRDNRSFVAEGSPSTPVLTGRNTDIDRADDMKINWRENKLVL